MRPAASLLLLSAAACLPRDNVEVPPLEGEVALLFSITDGQLSWDGTLPARDFDPFALSLQEADIAFLVTPTVPTGPIAAQADANRLSEAIGVERGVADFCAGGEVMNNGWVRFPVAEEDPVTLVAGAALPEDIRERISFAVPPRPADYDSPFRPYGSAPRIIPDPVTFDGSPLEQEEVGGIYNLRFLARLAPDRAAIGSRFALHVIQRGQAEIRPEDAIYRFPEGADLEGIAFESSTDRLHAAWKICDSSDVCRYSRVDTFEPGERLFSIASSTVPETIRDLAMDDRGRRIYPTANDRLLIHDGRRFLEAIPLTRARIEEGIYTGDTTDPFAIAAASGILLGDPFGDGLRTITVGGQVIRSLGAVTRQGALSLWTGGDVSLKAVSPRGAAVEIRLHLPRDTCGQRDPGAEDPSAESCGETVPDTRFAQIVQWAATDGGDDRVYFLLEACNFLFAISPETNAVTAYRARFPDGQDFRPRVLLPTPEGILIGAEDGMMGVLDP